MGNGRFFNPTPSNVFCIFCLPLFCSPLEKPFCKMYKYLTSPMSFFTTHLSKLPRRVSNPFNETSFVHVLQNCTTPKGTNLPYSSPHPDHPIFTPKAEDDILEIHPVMPTSVALYRSNLASIRSHCSSSLHSYARPLSHPEATDNPEIHTPRYFYCRTRGKTIFSFHFYEKISIFESRKFPSFPGQLEKMSKNRIFEKFTKKTFSTGP